MELCIDDLRPGDRAVLGCRSHRFTSTFDGWTTDDSGQQRAMFHGDDGARWEARFYKGRLCVGSSARARLADALTIFALSAPR